MADSGPRDGHRRDRDRDRDSRREHTREPRGGGSRGSSGDYTRDSRGGGRRDDHRDRGRTHHARSRSPRGGRREPHRQRSPRGGDARSPYDNTNDSDTTTTARGGDHDRAPRGSDDRRPTSRDPPPPFFAPTKPVANFKKSRTAMDLDDPASASDDDETAAMKKVMGFAGFRSTKNTKVPGNDRLYGVRKDKQTEYRQYMNRVGGFNRPLSPSQM